MKNTLTTLFFIGVVGAVSAQEKTTNSTDPAVTSWLQNTTQVGSYYVQGNSTPIASNILVNVQAVQYSADWVYVSTTGVPAYVTGPFLDGNTAVAEDQEAIFKIPLVPTVNGGAPTETTAGNIGIFVNGVALFDYRDGVAWNPQTNSLCGGPGNPPCPGGPMAVMDWNRDAVLAEMAGYDCAKGHPAGGNYHHHQNPSAFDLDLNVLSTICNLYDADGLYAIDSTQHSPLIGFAYDGYPIYGAYGYANSDGTGGITRIKSSYQLRNIMNRTHHADGTNVDDGPPVDATYVLGYFREDYEYIAHPNEDDYLDEHNGRFCVTPEYPNGTYAYFCTVDEDWNSAYPYAVGPTFYGNVVAENVPTITETVSTYLPTSIDETAFNNLNFSVYPNPASDFVAIQANGLVKDDIALRLYNMQGQLVRDAEIKQGSTIWYLDIQTLYAGTYMLHITSGKATKTQQIVIQR